MYTRDREFSAVEVQRILRAVYPDSCERLNLSRLNQYQALVPRSGKTRIKNRAKYSFDDLLLLAIVIDLRKSGLTIKAFGEQISHIRELISVADVFHEKRLKAIIKTSQSESLYVVYVIPRLALKLADAIERSDRRTEAA